MIAQRIQTAQRLPLALDRLTARAAFAIVEPVAKSYDERADIDQITAEIDIDANGLSRNWAFHCFLPQQETDAHFVVRFHPGNWWLYQDGLGWYLYRDVHVSLLAPETLISRVLQLGRVPDELIGAIVGNALAQLLAEGNMNPEYFRQDWQEQLRTHPPLPIPFRDSPEAVRALMNQGADFIGTDITLEATTTPDQGAVWRARTLKTIHDTTFALDE